MSHAEKRRWWIGPLLWSLLIIAGLVAACIVSEEAREVIGEGTGYLLGFFSTPFILEASTFCVGLAIVMIINNLRIEREGEGWVEMEVPDAANKSADSTQTATTAENTPHSSSAD